MPLPPLFGHPRHWMQRLSDFAFGYDFFISYRRDDGTTLPRSLAARLTAMGLRVFLDEKVYVAGDDLSGATRRRIAMSSYLLLVARPGAMCRSPWVATEVELSNRAGKRLVVLDVDGAYTSTTGATPEEAARAAKLREVIAQRIRIPLDTGTETGIFDGAAPEAVLDDIRRSFTATRQDTRRSAFFAAASIAFAVLAGAAVFFGWQADSARRQAQAQAAVSRAGELAARSDAVRNDRPQLSGLLARAAVMATTQRGDPAVQTAMQALQDSVLALSGGAVERSVGPARLVATNATGSRLASAASQRVQWWDLAEHGGFALRREVETRGDVTFIGFGQGDLWLAAGGKDFLCFLHLEDAGKDACRALGPDEELLETAFSPDGRHLVGIRYGNSIVAWDLSTADAAGSLRVLGRGLHTVRDARFSSDGKWLLAWGITNTDLWLWSRSQIEDGTSPTVMQGHTSPIKTADVNGHAGLAVSADDDGNVRLWQLSPGKASSSLLLPAGAGQWTTSVAFSPDGQWLGVPRRLGLPDDKPATDMMLYRIANRVVSLRARLAHDSYTDRQAFDPGSSFLLALGSNGTNWLWDLRGPLDERQSRLVAHLWPTTAYAFSADGTRLVTSDSVGRAYSWDLGCHWGRPVPRPLRGLEGPAAAWLFGSPGGWLAGGDGRNLRHWDAALPALGEPLVLADDCHANIDKVLTSSSGRWLATAGMRGISVFDAAAAQPFARTDLLDAAVQVEAAGMAGDGQRLAVCLKGGEVLVWELPPKALDPATPLRLPATGPSCAFMDFSRNGYLAATDVDGSGSLWNLESADPRASRVALGSQRQGIPKLSHDARYVVALGGDSVKLWDRQASPQTAAFVTILRTAYRLHDAVFSPDGRWLLVRGDEHATLWELARLPQAPARTYAFAKGDWLDVAFSPDGRWLFVPVPGAFELWDLAAPQQGPGSRLELPASPTQTARSAFDAKGQWFMSGQGSTIRLWDLGRPGQPPTVLDTGGGEVETLAFSADGRWLAFGARDGTVGVRPVQAADDAGFVRSALQTGSVRGLMFSANGDWLVSATYSSVRKWPIGIDQLMALAAQRIGREAEANEVRFYLGQAGGVLPTDRR